MSSPVDASPEAFGLSPRSPTPAETKGIEAGGRYRIDYTNWRGERAQRAIRVLSFGYGTTKYHPEPDLMVIAIDEEKAAARTFALASVHDVEQIS